MAGSASGFTQGGADGCGCEGAAIFCAAWDCAILAACAGVGDVIFFDFISENASVIASCFQPTDSSCWAIWSSLRLFWRALRMNAISFSLTIRPQGKYATATYKFA